MVRRRSDLEDMNERMESDPDHLGTRPRLILHERICGLRHKAINGRLSRIETILWSTSFALLGGMAWMIFTLITRVPHG